MSSTPLALYEAPGDALALMGVVASIGSNCGKPGKPKHHNNKNPLYSAVATDFRAFNLRYDMFMYECNCFAEPNSSRFITP